MYWRLSETVTACVASDRILFLDVGRDRYFALPSGYNEPFLSWLTEWQDEDLARRCRTILADLKIISSEAARAVVPTACTVERPQPVDAEPLPPSRIRAGALVTVGKAVLSAWHDVRSKPLGAVLARRLSEARFASSAPGDMRSRLAEFRSVRPFIPVRRICLHDCLALVDWLGPARAGAQLVFGVSAYPFAAHCWVQANGVVLDDHPESPSRFQPILHFP